MNAKVFVAYEEINWVTVGASKVFGSTMRMGKRSARTMHQHRRIHGCNWQTSVLLPCSALETAFRCKNASDSLESVKHGETEPDDGHAKIVGLALCWLLGDK